MDYLKAIAELERNVPLHLARLLLLLLAFDDGVKSHGINGLTKLAKLDFFLRYPVMLNSALKEKNRSAKPVKIQEFETRSVESHMVRYRFGPWDHRYRNFLNTLMAKKLVLFDAATKPILIYLTDEGRQIAENLSATEEFQVTAERSKVLKRHFDLLGTNLMKFIYEKFPEVVSLRSNEVIDI